MVGRTPWSAADAPVGLLAPGTTLTLFFKQRDEGVLAQRAPRPGVRPTISAAYPAATYDSTRNCLAGGGLHHHLCTLRSEICSGSGAHVHH